jgi:hypothetical protein
MLRKWIVLLPALAICIASACSDVLVACSGTGRYPIKAVVLDSLTREPIAVGSRLIVRFGVRADTVTGMPGGPSLASTIYGGPEDGAGVFGVDVIREGYRVWANESVTVSR